MNGENIQTISDDSDEYGKSKLKSNYSNKFTIESILGLNQCKSEISTIKGRYRMHDIRKVWNWIEFIIENSL